MDDLGSVTALVNQLKAGKSQATEELWRRYYAQLVSVARRRLGSVPRRVGDEEDVLVDAFDSFFRGVQEGRFPRLEDRDDLWQILLMLTARKAANQVKHQKRKKRGGGAVRGDSVLGNQAVLAGSQPSPEFVAMLSDEIERMLRRLDDEVSRRVATYRMEGLTNEEIANRLGCSVRTVVRKLRLIRKTLELAADTGPT